MNHNLFLLWPKHRIKVTTCTKYIRLQGSDNNFCLILFIDPVYSSQNSLSNFHVISSFACPKYQQTLTEVVINF